MSTRDRLAALSKTFSSLSLPRPDRLWGTVFHVLPDDWIVEVDGKDVTER